MTKWTDTPPLGTPRLERRERQRAPRPAWKTVTMREVVRAIAAANGDELRARRAGHPLAEDAT